MDKETIIEKLKDIIAGIAFRLFLWAAGRTQEQYWQEIYEQEVNYKKEEGV